MVNWKIKLLDTGSSEIEASILTYLSHCGEKVRVPRLVVYLEGPKKVIVDTGVGSIEDGIRYLGERDNRTPEQEPLNALHLAGINPDDIDIVVLTHLHWDHCGNNNLFPKADVIVQQDELRYAIAPDNFFARGYMSPQIGATPPWWGSRFVTIQGEAEIAEGLHIILTPGHTPAHQSLLVQTSQGVCCVAGDAVMSYENFEKMIPPGYHWRVYESLVSLQRISHSCDYFIPSHDYSVFEDNKLT
jgi:N-acyl homoserine lactone hydrolase